MSEPTLDKPPGLHQPSNRILEFRKENQAKVEQQINTLKGKHPDADVNTLESWARDRVAGFRRLEKSHEETRNALIDPLTRLVRRNVFTTETKKHMALADRNQRRLRLGITVGDLDHFGAVNKRFGTNIGDQVLEGVGRALTESTRDTDLASRWGGEEFAINMPYVSATLKSPRKVRVENHQYTERVRTSISRVVIPGTQEPVTATFGSTEYIAAIGTPADVRYKPGETFESFFERASTALRIAKLLGRNRTIYAARSHQNNDNLILRDITNNKIYQWKIDRSLETPLETLDEVTEGELKRFNIVTLEDKTQKLEAAA